MPARRPLACSALPAARETWRRWRVRLRLAVRQGLRRPRRTLAVAASVVLAGTAFTALAVAPRGEVVGPAQGDRVNDGVAGLMVREPLVLPALATQARALAEQTIELVHGTVSRDTDGIESLFERLGVRDAEAAAALTTVAALAPMASLLAGRAGVLLHARTDAAGRLIELSARHAGDAPVHGESRFERVVAGRHAGAWQVRVEQLPYERELKLAAATVDTTFVAATESAGLPAAVSGQLAAIFAAELDLHREVERGDRLAVVYEALSADGEPVPWNDGIGRVMAAEFITGGPGGRRHRALWFAPDAPAGTAAMAAAAPPGAHFRPEGQSRRRAFLASPLEFARVSSDFALQPNPADAAPRVHLGIDYAAPNGAAVHAVGEGTVEFAGWMNGYGLTVTVAHGEGRETLYAHLSRIDVRPGERVGQGRVLGTVGATGWATGPHLHFEFRVDGVHQDPGALPPPVRAQWVPARARAAFARQRQWALDQLALAASLDSGVALAGPGALAGAFPGRTLVAAR